MICITNYINRERDNIKFMTIRMGAAYSGPLTRGRTTHLVAARYGEMGECVLHMTGWAASVVVLFKNEKCGHWMSSGGMNEKQVDSNKSCPTVIPSSPHGEKYKMACEWGVPVVSHLWLEEMFKRWELVPDAGFRKLVQHHMPLPAPLREVCLRVGL